MAVASLLLLLSPFLQAQEDPASTARGGEPLELTDLMKLRQIEGPAISDDGEWIWYALVPDRGDGEAVARRTRETEGARGGVFRIERGTSPQVSADGAWFAALVQAPLEERLAAEESEDGEAPKTGLELVALELASLSGEGRPGGRTSFERVERFAFSADGAWLARQHLAEDDEEDGGEGDGEGIGGEGQREETAQVEGEEEESEAQTEGEVPGAPSPEEPGREEPGAEEPAAGEIGSREPAAEQPRTEQPPPEQATGETPPGMQEVKALEAEGKEAAEETEENLGTPLVLRRLADGSEIEIPWVESFAFDATGAWLAYTVAAPGGEGNGVYLRSLAQPAGPGTELEEGLGERVAHRREGGRYGQLTWTEEEVVPPRLAFVASVWEEPVRVEPAAEETAGEGEAAAEAPEPVEAGSGEAKSDEPLVGEVWSWQPGGSAGGSDGGSDQEAEAVRLVGEGSFETGSEAGDEASEGGSESHREGGWYVPFDNQLTFSRDGERLFFGRKPAEERAWVEGEDAGAEDEEAGSGEDAGGVGPYDVEEILEDRTVTVWHGDDPLIQSNQKEMWEEVAKRTYTAVVHLDEPGDGTAAARVVPLADRRLREVERTDNPRAALGVDREPYFRQRTWEGFFADAWWVDLEDGSRRLVARRLAQAPELSPGGRYAVFWEAPHWYLFDSRDGSVRNLTEGLPVPFANEDHDYPAPPAGYGVAGWLEGDAAVLIYDKYDLWQIPTAAGASQEAFRWTGGQGRERRVRFRLLDLDPERDFLRPGEGALLSEYDEDDKSHGFARARVGRPGVETLLHQPKKFDFLAKAEEADRVLYTRESYREFPDLWVAELGSPGSSDDELALADRRRLSRANPGLDRYAWGTAELVRWESADGTPLDGVLIKPGNYRQGERYPVLVYFYRFFSQRLHEFNEPVVNHRPSFPFYASHGYAVFLPDVRFEVGRPGLSAVKALVPGVQKLVEIGVADPQAIGLHGHSWSGYQAAFVVTQTDLFAAAVAGAPVSNMTSAYSGIRYGTGLARQFQYEQSQSRIGGSLWEARHLYVENSPVFYADRVETPLLIQFGDRDEAVPWTQGIELYLALRRLDKEVVFLQYEGEPHHLETYANKLDYSIKMKQFFDHHLKGQPAPDWMAEGVPYRGE